MLRSGLATFTRCALEHGGAASVLVERDAGLDRVISLRAKSGFYHVGQLCGSAQRVFDHEAIVRSLADHLAAARENMRVGNPLDPDNEVGPLIRPAEVQRLHKWVGEAIRGVSALPSAFQASVFARDIGFSLGAVSRLVATAVMIDDHTVFRVDWMPFAGLKQSGLGVGGIPYIFRDMRVEKLIAMHSPSL